jgi:site-specific DNA recombinase
MSNRAALYLRSSKDRADISIDAQRRDLHDLAMARGLVVVEEFADAVESGKDEDRPGFQAVIRAIPARGRGWEHILVLDTSRIARRIHIAVHFERDCEKANIRVHYKNLPDIDPITGNLLKVILQGMDEWHSMTSRAKGLAGMAENIRQGWRAGGRAPRGYKLEYHSTGAVRDGAPVLKSKLTPSEEAESVAAYLSARARGVPRGSALQMLQLDWEADSLNPLEWQALTFAGHTVWNVHNEVTKDGYKTGEKRKPRADWMIQRDTHPALISESEAEAILAQLEKQRTRRTRASDRPYLLTGFLVTPAGQSWHGEWDSRMDAALYRVGKGKKIAARRIDHAVVDRLLEDLQSDEVVEHVTKALKDLVDEPIDGRKIVGLEKRLESMTRKVGKLVDLLTDADGAAMDAYKRTISQLEGERAALVAELADLRSRANQHVAVQAFSPDDARRLMRILMVQLKEGLDTGEVITIKAALGGLIDRIELDPESESCTIHYRIATPDTGVMMASPRQIHATPVTWSASLELLPKLNRKAA